IFSRDWSSDVCSSDLFQRLQQRRPLRRALDIRRGQITPPARLWLFDLIAFEDRDLRKLPLTVRKALLRRLLPSAGILRYSEHIEIGRAPGRDMLYIQL